MHCCRCKLALNPKIAVMIDNGVDLLTFCILCADPEHVPDEVWEAYCYGEPVDLTKPKEPANACLDGEDDD